MSFAARETSRHLGEPINLYKFGIGDIVYGYTDAEQAVTFEGDTYSPMPVDRSPISSSGTLDKAALTVNLPQETEVAELFRVTSPSDVVSLIIFQGHEGDPEFLAVWSGRVLSCGRNDHEAELTCEPVSTSMKRPGLREHYQYGCPLVLYGPRCRATKVQREIELIGVAQGTLFQTDIGWEGPYTLDNYIGGLVEWTREDGRAEIRSIKEVNEFGEFRVNGAATDLSAGATVLVTVGCNHRMDDCETVHNNIVNYGGCPWIPLSSPLGMVNNYY